MKNCPEIKINLSDMKRAMEIIDSNQNGLIDYTEFIAACLQSSSYLKENHLKAAFSFFDKDGSGTISRSELRQCLQSEDFAMTEEEINTMLEGVDADGDGEVVVDYVENKVDDNVTYMTGDAYDDDEEDVGLAARR